MTDVSKSVFISYRRSTSSFIARAVFMDLRTNGYDVFLDVETIDSGAFDKMILNQIAARTHFILVLTPGALEQCSEAGDWLRREIEHAMQLERNIVPLLVNEFTFAGNEQYLTGALSSLPRYNAVKLFPEYFDEAMERLRKRYLKQPEHRVQLQQPPQADASIAERKIEVVMSQETPTLQQLRAEACLTRALLRDADDFDGQISDYTEAIDLYPKFTQAYISRGLIYVKKSDYDRAIEDFDRAIQARPNSAEAYYYRGNIYAEKENFDHALEDYDAAIRLSPENVEDFNEELQLLRMQTAVTYHNRALRAFDRNEYDAALADYKKANHVMPGFNLILAGMAITHHAMGHISEAVRLWKHLVTYNEQYRHADWVYERWKFGEKLADEARRLIARL